MKIELENNKVFFKNQGLKKEIHPFWLRERVNGDSFVDKRTHLNDIFNNDELIFYNDIEDLSQKIKFYKLNSNLRNKISHKGKNKYFKLFNEKRVCDFFIKKITGKNFNLF